jgi:hypothetical protein
MTRAERAAQAASLRAEGLLIREIANTMGISVSFASELLRDPTGAMARERKAKRFGFCRGCGKKLTNSGSEPGARCVPCNAAHTREMSRRWILESFAEWEELFGAPPTANDWNPALALHHACTAWKAERHRQTGRAWPSVTLVANIFGSWSEGVRAAGFEPNGTGQYGRLGEDPAVRQEAPDRRGFRRRPGHGVQVAGTRGRATALC